MNTITARQSEILMLIIQEYMGANAEVGSNLIVDKYDLGLSSATIRNEMAKLMTLGLLIKSHVSSGRIPTDQAIRMYVNNLTEVSELDPLEENDINQNVFRERFEKDKLISGMLELLTKYSRSASFVLTDAMVRYYGVSALMKYEELQKVHVLERVFDLLENCGLLRKMFSTSLSNEIGILIGAETGIQDLENCSIVYGSMPFWGGENIYYGVVGTRRMDYRHIINVVRGVRNAVDKALRGWV